MKYTITKAPQGGYVIEKQREHWPDRELEAVAPDMASVGDYFHGTQNYIGITRKRVSALLAARELVKCFGTYQQIKNKVSCIKMVRLASGCGLKEAKEAVEQAIEERDS